MVGEVQLHAITAALRDLINVLVSCWLLAGCWLAWFPCLSSSISHLIELQLGDAQLRKRRCVFCAPLCACF